MENLTHSLIGATLSELFVPRSASPAKRGFFLPSASSRRTSPTPICCTRVSRRRRSATCSIIAATRTRCVGIAALGAAFGLLMLIPRVRRGLADCRGRFWGLVACALLSHIVADAWNSYGVHPFWPFDNRWYYGDAINIYEPWLWVILGVTVALNTRARSTKFALAAVLIALPLAMTGLRMISPLVLGALATGGAVWALVAAGWSPTSARGDVGRGRGAVRRGHVRAQSCGSLEDRRVDGRGATWRATRCDHESAGGESALLDDDTRRARSGGGCIYAAARDDRDHVAGVFGRLVVCVGTGRYAISDGVAGAGGEELLGERLAAVWAGAVYAGRANCGLSVWRGGGGEFFEHAD